MKNCFRVDKHRYVKTLDEPPTGWYFVIVRKAEKKHPDEPAIGA